MGILWHAVFARFKSRLTLLDLERATEDTFDLCVRDAATSAMFQALRDSDPPIDHQSRWRDEFRLLLERISTRPSRKSQAAECRRIILERIDKRSLLWALIGIRDAEIREALANTFFQDLSPGVPDVMQLATKRYLYYLLDGMALTLLYTQQFNTPTKLDSFDTAYDAMCKASAEIIMKKVLASGIVGSETRNGSPTGEVYRKEIVEPLEAQLEDIKGDFRDNLCLLSPATPDSSRFLDFLSRYSKQLEAFKKASSNEQAAV